ncbi:MAG: LptE family protein [Candidatus Eisenbacteria sp.]|nr:LptE family protein [Candidatus Eisenbacteria bacterium]
MCPSRPRVLLRTTLFVALSLLCACAHYSTSASGRSSLKSIAIPLFKNNTLEHGLGETVTSALSAAFVADNHLDVVAEPESESILWGTIVEYRRFPFTFDSQGAVIEYKIEIVVSVEYEDRKHSRTLWADEDLRAWASYTPATSASADEPDQSVEESTIAATEEEALLAAIGKLGRELVAKTLGGW